MAAAINTLSYILFDPEYGDRAAQMHEEIRNEQAMLAFSPHGIFPFSIAFPALLSQTMGTFRPVVASATAFLPIVRDFLSCLSAVYVTFQE